MKHAGIDAIQIVAAPQWHEKIVESLTTYDKDKKFRGFSAPGENRQLSIYHGLTDIRSFAKDSDIVLVHDAARPLLSEQIITDSLSAVEGHDGVLPILSMKDTVYKSEDGRRIDALLDRDKLFAGQAPEQRLNNLLRFPYLAVYNRDRADRLVGRQHFSPGV